jgi:23S rRNA (cytidine1920-2'-O)/16S rRNA (cytidine1409-2'-O)-methyltransferase
MKERADKVLVDKKLVSSRSQAKSLIDKGDVLVNGVTLKKAGDLIDPESEIKINSPLYVGRGAFKLEKALDEFHINPADKICLDVGASTGGFTEVLLLHHASKVYAIDVGSGQLAEKLKHDLRVINLENTNIKELHELPDLADLAVMDLSFISITKVLDNVSLLLKARGELIALVKPQFEIGREDLPKDGVVKLEEDRLKALNNVMTYATQNGWQILGQIVSPIEGKMGNQEYLLHLKRSEI